MHDAPLPRCFVIIITIFFFLSFFLSFFLLLFLILLKHPLV